MLAWPNKDPDEVLDYGFDWGKKRLEAGESIISSEWEVALGSVEIASSPAPPSHTADKTKVWIQGGEAGEPCILTNRIETDAGRTREWSAKLKIKVSG